MAQVHDNESNDGKMASYDTYFGIMFVIVPRVSRTKYRQRQLTRIVLTPDVLVNCNM